MKTQIRRSGDSMSEILGNNRKINEIATRLHDGKFEKALRKQIEAMLVLMKSRTGPTLIYEDNNKE